MSVSNLSLRLDRAGLTAEQFAEIVGVDPKTVQRWIAGRTPYRRHRATIARALDTPEHELWPDDVPAPATAPRDVSPPVGSSDASSPFGSGDVAGAWGEAGQSEAPDPGLLLLEASGPVDVFDTGRELLHDDRLIAALLDAAAAGSPVRVLVDVPRHELCPLIDVPRVELRVLEESAGGAGLIRIAERMLVYLDLPGELDQARPLLDLHDRSPAGLFARYHDHFEDLWEQAGDPIQTDEQLDDLVLLEADAEEDDEANADTDPPSPDDHSEPPVQSTPPAPDAGEGRRRWPRRPN